MMQHVEAIYGGGVLRPVEPASTCQVAAGQRHHIGLDRSLRSLRPGRCNCPVLHCKSLPRMKACATVAEISDTPPRACGEYRAVVEALSLKGFRARFGDRLVLFAHTAADSYRANHLTALLQWNASGENHDTPVI